MSRSRSRSHTRSHTNTKQDIPTTLYVRNINKKTTDTILSEVFSKYGEIKDIHIPLDYYTKEVRGFAYIKYKLYNDAENALKNLNDIEIEGRNISISWAEGTRKTSYDMKKKDNKSSYRRKSRSRSRSNRRHRSRRDSRSRSRSRSREHRSSRKRSYTRSRSRDRSRDRRSRKHSSSSSRSRSRSRRSHRHERRRTRSPKVDDRRRHISKSERKLLDEVDAKEARLEEKEVIETELPSELDRDGDDN